MRSDQALNREFTRIFRADKQFPARSGWYPCLRDCSDDFAEVGRRHYDARTGQWSAMAYVSDSNAVANAMAKFKSPIPKHRIVWLGLARRYTWA